VDYPVKVINDAREMYLTPVVGKKNPWMTFDAIAKAINIKHKIMVPRQTVHAWVKQYKWTRPESTTDVSVSVATAPQPSVPQQTQSRELTPSGDWDWELRKGKFLANLAGLAETCLAVDTNGTLIFRDDESRIKTGIAAVEMIGKIQAGKFDKAERGDMVPSLSKDDLKAVLMFFTDPAAETPKLAAGPGDVIDVDAEEAGDDEED
jgi:hypothetical protein